VTTIHFNNKITSPTTGNSLNSKTRSITDDNLNQEESFEQNTSKFSNNSLNNSTPSIFNIQKSNVVPDNLNIFAEANFERKFKFL
jgi:hypothetical protein